MHIHSGFECSRASPENPVERGGMIGTGMQGIDRAEIGTGSGNPDDGNDSAGAVAFGVRATG